MQGTTSGRSPITQVGLDVICNALCCFAGNPESRYVCTPRFPLVCMSIIISQTIDENAGHCRCDLCASSWQAQCFERSDQHGLQRCPLINKVHYLCRSKGCIFQAGRLEFWCVNSLDIEHMHVRVWRSCWRSTVHWSTFKKK